MTLERRLDALRELVTLGAGRVPEAQSGEMEALLDRAAQRRALSAAHTVVGLFGATGSGKSSLLNALAGEQIARAHVRRPTTAEPLALIWNPADASALLDWLDVRERVVRDSPIHADATELMLIDLPDFDSVVAEHRATAERLAGQVDVLVWVVDPQKYADAVLHTGFLRRHARHGAVTLVVLNQVDLVSAADVPRVVDSLRALLDEDGLRGVRILPTSATTGEGVDALRAAIGGFAKARQAQTERLTSDVAVLAAAIEEPGAAPRTAKGQEKAAFRELTEQLGRAAGVDVVANAVAGSYRKRAAQATGWPLVSWIPRFRADPLARLGLRARKDAERDPELHRTSLPPMSAAGEAAVSMAVRRYADAASDGLTEPWRAGVREAGSDAAVSLPPELDLAISRATLPAKGSWWWVVFAILQWLSIAAALAGVLWLLAIAFLPRFGLNAPEVPEVEGWPLTTLLILGGMLLGILLGLAGAGIAALTAASRRRRARKALLAEVAKVAEQSVVAPIAAELDRARRFANALGAARGG